MRADQRDARVPPSPRRPCASTSPTSCTPGAGFHYCALFVGTDAGQPFTVPQGVTSIRADLTGSGGGGGDFDSPDYGGHGGATSGTVHVASGQALRVTVGTLSYGTGGAAGLGSRGNAGVGGGLSALWSGNEYESAPICV